MTVTYALINILLCVAITALCFLIVNLAQNCIGIFFRLRDERRKAKAALEEPDDYIFPRLMCRGSGRVAELGQANGVESVWCGTCHRRFSGMQEAEINPERTHSVVPVHYN